MAHQFSSTRSLFLKWLAFKSFVMFAFLSMFTGWRTNGMSTFLWICSGIAMLYALYCEIKLIYKIECDKNE